MASQLVMMVREERTYGFARTETRKTVLSPTVYTSGIPEV